MLVIRDGRRGGGGGAGGCRKGHGKKSNPMRKRPQQQMNNSEFLVKVIIRILCRVQSHTFGALVFKFPVCKVGVLLEVDTRDCTVT